MLVIDGDYPMANGAIRSQRELTVPIEEARNLSPDFSVTEGRPDTGIMATIPEMRKAEVAAAIVKVLNTEPSERFDGSILPTRIAISFNSSSDNLCITSFILYNLA